MRADDIITYDRMRRAQQLGFGRDLQSAWDAIRRRHGATFHLEPSFDLMEVLTLRFGMDHDERYFFRRMVSLFLRLKLPEFDRFDILERFHAGVRVHALDAPIVCAPLIAPTAPSHERDAPQWRLLGPFSDDLLRWYHQVMGRREGPLFWLIDDEAAQVALCVATGGERRYRLLRLDAGVAAAVSGMRPRLRLWQRSLDQIARLEPVAVGARLRVRIREFQRSWELPHEPWSREAAEAVADGAGLVGPERALEVSAVEAAMADQFEPADLSGEDIDEAMLLRRSAAVLRAIR
jgi:hypothetical protein